MRCATMLLVAAAAAAAAAATGAAAFDGDHSMLQMSALDARELADAHARNAERVGAFARMASADLALWSGGAAAAAAAAATERKRDAPPSFDGVVAACKTAIEAGVALHNECEFGVLFNSSVSLSEKVAKAGEWCPSTATNSSCFARARFAFRNVRTKCGALLLTRAANDAGVGVKNLIKWAVSLRTAYRLACIKEPSSGDFCFPQVSQFIAAATAASENSTASVADKFAVYKTGCNACLRIFLRRWIAVKFLEKALTPASGASTVALVEAIGGALVYKAVCLRPFGDPSGFCVDKVQPFADKVKAGQAGAGGGPLEKMLSIADDVCHKDRCIARYLLATTLLTPTSTLRTAIALRGACARDPDANDKLCLRKVFENIKVAEVLAAKCPAAAQQARGKTCEPATCKAYIQRNVADAGCCAKPFAVAASSSAPLPLVKAASLAGWWRDDCNATLAPSCAAKRVRGALALANLKLTYVKAHLADVKRRIAADLALRLGIAEARIKVFVAGVAADAAAKAKLDAADDGAAAGGDRRKRAVLATTDGTEFDVRIEAEAASESATMTTALGDATQLDTFNLDELPLDARVNEDDDFSDAVTAMGVSAIAAADPPLGEEADGGETGAPSGDGSDGGSSPSSRGPTSAECSASKGGCAVCGSAGCRYCYAGKLFGLPVHQCLVKCGSGQEDRTDTCATGNGATRSAGGALVAVLAAVLAAAALVA